MPTVTIVVMDYKLGRTPDRLPIVGAEVVLTGKTTTAPKPKPTNEKGECSVDLKPDAYTADCFFGNVHLPKPKDFNVPGTDKVPIDLEVGVSAETASHSVEQGAVVQLKALPDKPDIYNYSWSVSGGSLVGTGDEIKAREVNWDTNGLRGGYKAKVTVSEKASAKITSAAVKITVLPRPVRQMDTVPVTMRRTATTPTEDLPLWVFIRKSTDAISFENYNKFMEMVFCGTDPADLKRKDEFRKERGELRGRRFLPYNDADAYRVLKVATEAFLVVNCGVALYPPDFSSDLAEVVRRVGTGTVDLDALWESYLKFINGDENRTIPYLALIRDKLRDVRLKTALFTDNGDLEEAEECFGILRDKLTMPCLLELIWSYWHEEGMLVQTLSAISSRFQNVRGPGDRDPLSQFEIDPLRPLNNLLWGYIQDEQHRLGLVRRAYEYDHHYGLTIYGKAVPRLRSADSRSKFIEAFHNLLHLCTVFFQQDDDTTVIADGFPVLNALKEVHLLLSEGAHNQFGDLPATARQEMLVQQWVLARPEFREFLPTRTMVAYPEKWMDRVDAMKKLQGWTDVSVLHFRNLGVFGEQILLSVRYGAWSTVNDPAQASNWARFWRAEIQGYTHGYRVVTGVELSQEPVNSTMPAVLLQRRIGAQAAATR